MRKIAFISLCGLLTLAAGCDDEENSAQLQGGGPGSSNPVDVTATGNGFCDPTGGAAALGTPAFNSGTVTAKIDTDGNPAMQATDATWQAGTSGSVNGQAVNSAQYNFVVMSPRQMQSSGVSLGDWAEVVNPGNGKATFARVEDKGPDGGLGEISQATATAVGIQYTASSATVGDPNVIVTAYAQSASVASDCSQTAAQNSI
jgi:hypothetical protein